MAPVAAPYTTGTMSSHKISFHAVDKLKIRVFLSDIVRGQHRFREALHHAVICDSDRAVTHAVGRFYDGFRVTETIHAAHFRMQMQEPLPEILAFPWLCMILIRTE